MEGWIKYKLKLVMPIVVEGVSLEKYLVWLNEQLEGPDSIESAGYNISALSSMLLICNRINNKILSYKKSLDSRLYSTKENKVYKNMDMVRY